MDIQVCTDFYHLNRCTHVSEVVVRDVFVTLSTCPIFKERQKELLLNFIDRRQQRVKSLFHFKLKHFYFWYFRLKISKNVDGWVLFFERKQTRAGAELILSSRFCVERRKTLWRRWFYESVWTEVSSSCDWLFSCVLIWFSFLNRIKWSTQINFTCLHSISFGQFDSSFVLCKVKT